MKISYVWAPYTSFHRGETPWVAPNTRQITIYSNDAYTITTHDGPLRTHVCLSNGVFHNLYRPALQIWRDEKLIYSAWYSHGVLHNLDGKPALRIWWPNGVCARSEYYIYGKLSNVLGPAIRVKYETGQIAAEEWISGGKHMRVEHPAVIHRYKSGKTKLKQFMLDGKLSRFRGPAHVEYDSYGNKKYACYYLNGVLERLGSGPVEIKYDSAGRKTEYYVETPDTTVAV